MHWPVYKWIEIIALLGQHISCIVPDHLGVYPYQLSNESSQRFMIPLIFTGGVITEPQRIETIGSQTDIAATLLGQLDISHDEFTFSKDIMNPDIPQFAFFTMPKFFGCITPEIEVIYDCSSNSVLIDEGENNVENVKKGQAYLQKNYDDIAKRE